MDIGIGDPATADQVDRFKKKIPFKMSAVIVGFIKEFGGKIPRNLPPDYVIPGNFAMDVSLGPFLLFSLAQIAQEHKDMMHLLKKEKRFQKIKIRSAKGIDSVWFSEFWLPIAGNGNGDLICVDLTPRKKPQQNGQLLLFAHELDIRPKLGDSIQEFFANLTAAYEDDMLYLSEESYSICKMREKDLPRLQF